MAALATIADVRRVLPTEILEALHETSVEVQKLSIDAALVAGNTFSLRVEGQLINEAFSGNSDTTLINLASAIGSVAGVGSSSVTIVPTSDGDDYRDIVIVAADTGDHIAITDLSVTGGGSQATPSLTDITNDSLDSNLQEYIDQADMETAPFIGSSSKVHHLEAVTTAAATGKIVDEVGNFLSKNLRQGWLVTNLDQVATQGTTTIDSITQDDEINLTDGAYDFASGERYRIENSDRVKLAQVYYACYLITKFKFPVPKRSSLGSPRVIAEYQQELSDSYFDQYKRAVGFRHGAV